MITNGIVESADDALVVEDLPEDANWSSRTKMDNAYCRFIFPSAIVKGMDDRTEDCEGDHYIVSDDATAKVIIVK